MAFEPDFVAFSIPDEFVVGYGLDYEDQYRNLPYVASMEEPDLKAIARYEVAADSRGRAPYVALV